MSISFPFTITSHLPSFNNFISIDNTSSEMANSYTFQCSWNYKKSTWQTRRYMPVHAHCLNCLVTESDTILCHNICVLLFANYLCCTLFYFQHYWKVLRLIVKTFFLVRWTSVLKIFPQNLGIQNHHLLQYFPSTKWLTVFPVIQS